MRAVIIDRPNEIRVGNVADPTPKADELVIRQVPVVSAEPFTHCPWRISPDTLSYRAGSVICW